MINDVAEFMDHFSRRMIDLQDTISVIRNEDKRKAERTAMEAAAAISTTPKLTDEEGRQLREYITETTAELMVSMGIEEKEQLDLEFESEVVSESELTERL